MFVCSVEHLKLVYGNACLGTETWSKVLMVIGNFHKVQDQMTQGMLPFWYRYQPDFFKENFFNIIVLERKLSLSHFVVLCVKLHRIIKTLLRCTKDDNFLPNSSFVSVAFNARCFVLSPSRAFLCFQRRMCGMDVWCHGKCT